MIQKTTTFRSVKIGDKVYQHNYYATDKWREVTNITQNGQTISLGIGVSAHKGIDTRTYIVGHEAEAIAVK